MRILMIGGTAFLGRALVEAALGRGHQVTIFHRGQTNQGLFPQAEELLGDRNSEFSSGDSPLFAGRQWEAVIDTCGYFPRQVQASATALAGTVNHYTFISSISVYASTHEKGVDESSPVAQMPEGPQAEAQTEITGENYGPLKALCEQAAEAAMPGQVLIIRPGLIVGPHDRTDRFTYWPWRVAQGGEVLAPGQPARGVQFIDVRDLAEWTIRLVEAGQTGIFNADSPPEFVSMQSLLETCKAVSGSDARFIWADDEFLLAHAVEPWMEMPLWIPASDPDSTGFFAVSVEKAIAAGLRYRPLETTVGDTIEFARSRPEERAWRAGLQREKEQELLEELKDAGD